MYMAIKCLTWADGVIVLFEMPCDELSQAIVAAGNEISGVDTEYGMDILVGSQVRIPIPATLFDHLAETQSLSIYCGEGDWYEMVKLYDLKINPKIIYQLSGVFYYKQRNAAEG